MKFQVGRENLGLKNFAGPNERQNKYLSNTYIWK